MFFPETAIQILQAADIPVPPGAISWCCPHPESATLARRPRSRLQTPSWIVPIGFAGNSLEMVVALYHIVLSFNNVQDPTVNYPRLIEINMLDDFVLDDTTFPTFLYLMQTVRVIEFLFIW